MRVYEQESAAKTSEQSQIAQLYGFVCSFLLLKSETLNRYNVLVHGTPSNANATS